MRSLRPVLVSDRQFRLSTTTKNMASKFTARTPNILGKVWNIDVEREYRKLNYLFPNPERSNGIFTESSRQLKLFIHQPSLTIMFHCFFGENFSEFEIAWKVISLLLELKLYLKVQFKNLISMCMWYSRRKS